MDLGLEMQLLRIVTLSEAKRAVEGKGDDYSVGFINGALHILDHLEALLELMTRRTGARKEGTVPGFKYCPTCGYTLEQLKEGTIDDVATYHERARCTICGDEWEATWSKGVHNELLHIAPVQPEDE